jgi:hypothetical protein
MADQAESAIWLSPLRDTWLELRVHVATLCENPQIGLKFLDHAMAAVIG